MIDVTGRIVEPEDIPLCPLCDQPVFQWDQAEVVTAFDCKALAHADCTLEVDHE